VLRFASLFAPLHTRGSCAGLASAVLQLQLKLGFLKGGGATLGSGPVVHQAVPHCSRSSLRAGTNKGSACRGGASIQANGPIALGWQPFSLASAAASPRNCGGEVCDVWDSLHRLLLTGAVLWGTLWYCIRPLPHLLLILGLWISGAGRAPGWWQVWLGRRPGGRPIRPLGPVAAPALDSAQQARLL
jgi:hypothetical protein